VKNTGKPVERNTGICVWFFGVKDLFFVMVNQSREMANLKGACFGPDMIHWIPGFAGGRDARIFSLLTDGL
jgi:hypothetical protein